MTAPIPSAAASESAPSGTTVSTPVEAPASAPAGSAATTPAESGKGNGKTHDYEREAREWNSRYDKYKAQWNPVEERMSKYGLTPERVAGSLDQLVTLWTHPQLGPVVQQVASGGEYKPETLAAKPAAAEEPQPWRDPDLVALEQKYEAKLTEMADEIRNLRGTTQASYSIQAKDTLSRYLDTFMGQYPMLTNEEKSSVTGKILEKFTWTANNNPALIFKMNQDSFNGLAVPEVVRAVPLATLGERVVSQRQQGIAARGTDPRLGAQTTGREAPPPQTFDRTPSQQDLQRTAREAVDALRRERGWSGPIRP